MTYDWVGWIFAGLLSQDKMKKQPFNLAAEVCSPVPLSDLQLMPMQFCSLFLRGPRSKERISGVYNVLVKWPVYDGSKSFLGGRRSSIGESAFVDDGIHLVPVEPQTR